MPKINRLISDDAAGTYIITHSYIHSLPEKMAVPFSLPLAYHWLREFNFFFCSLEVCVFSSQSEITLYIQYHTFANSIRNFYSCVKNSIPEMVKYDFPKYFFFAFLSLQSPLNGMMIFEFQSNWACHFHTHLCVMVSKMLTYFSSLSWLLEWVRSFFFSFFTAKFSCHTS